MFANNQSQSENIQNSYFQQAWCRGYVWVSIKVLFYN